MVTIRLEEVSTNYTAVMGTVFDALLRGLALPAAMNGGEGGLAKRLIAAVSKFDLSRHAPMPDKVDHVSDVGEKTGLRQILLADGRVRPLLRGLRQALRYEPMLSWQSPPDMQRLSSAIDTTVEAFWKRAIRTGDPGGAHHDRYKLITPPPTP